MAKQCIILLFAIHAFTYALAGGRNDTIATKDRQSLLWRISGKGLQKPSYLFGTIHMLCPQDYLWTPAMRRSLLQCSQVCFEMDMDDPKTMTEVGMGMIDNSGKSLQDYFSADQYAMVSLFISDSLHLDIAMMQQLKPAALLSLFAMRATDCPSPVSYESKIQDQAKKAGKVITGLEDASEQIALLDKIPIDQIVADVLKTVEGKGDDKKAYYKLLAAYKKQDLWLLYDLIIDARESGDNTYAFLDERNIKWIDRMEEQMEQKAVFFAVGAGHLWSENGLINLLRKSGYNVEAIR